MKIDPDIKLIMIFAGVMAAILVLCLLLGPTQAHADVCMNQTDNGAAIQNLQSGQMCADMLTDYQASVDNLKAQLGLEEKRYDACEKANAELKKGMADMETKCAEAVKAAIRQLIDAEDPKAVLSDDTLVDLLKERGFDLARRTVAKYREAIGLGSSVQRRRQKALAGVR